MKQPPVVMTIRPWAFNDTSRVESAGREVRTRHYLIRSTVLDPAVLRRFALVMERANVGYRQLVGGRAFDGRPMPVYLFDTLEQWQQFTIATTGDDAGLYLQVRTGGYTVGERFVCWLANETDTLTVAAHEGLHQYVARHFDQRFPPALEEGLAAMFESVRVDGDVVKIDTARNARRSTAVRRAADAQALLPLKMLVTLHAGQFVGRPAVLRETFYAQAWGLAMMLSTDARYRPAFVKLTDDLANGRARPDVGRSTDAGMYAPGAVWPLLERYFDAGSAEFGIDYRENLRRLARAGED